MSKDTICARGFRTGPYRNVPPALKQQVYAAYGITSRQPGQYEVDHLIALENGGANDIENLWPQPATPVPGWHEKDQVENYVHQKVCSGALVLADAQRQLATDWTQFLTAARQAPTLIAPKQHEEDVEVDTETETMEGRIHG